MRYARFAATAILPALGLTLHVGAQGVIIAPQAVIVSGSGGGTLTIINPAEGRVEIGLSTIYGYPVTDEAGQLRLRTFDAVEDSMPSAAGWITAYPRRFTLDAGQRQTVRLVFAPPRSATAGEYWARLVVSSKGAQAPSAVAVADSSQAVSMRFDLEVRSILPILYRRGAVRTKLSIDTVSTDRTIDSLGVRPNMHREGNAAWVGTISVGLLDAGNVQVRRIDLPLAVYYSLAPRIALPLHGLPAGRYTLEVNAVAKRPDLAPHQVLSSPAQVHRTQVRVP